jgi:hypothetical protein
MEPTIEQIVQEALDRMRKTFVQSAPPQAMRSAGSAFDGFANGAHLRETLHDLHTDLRAAYERGRAQAEEIDRLSLVNQVLTRSNRDLLAENTISVSADAAASLRQELESYKALADRLGRSNAAARRALDGQYPNGVTVTFGGWNSVLEPGSSIDIQAVVTEPEASPGTGE